MVVPAVHWRKIVCYILDILETVKQYVITTIVYI